MNEHKPSKVVVSEEYQTGYEYRITAPLGENFDKQFKPDLTPKQMLSLGVFGGNYFVEVPSEFPKDWFNNVVFSRTGYSDKRLNHFKVNASQPLKVWQKKGWIHEEDPKGWFLWYCRYYMGRRIPEEDKRQIKRWSAMRRHVSQIKNNCAASDKTCRPRQRQALLHWAYDSREI